MDKLEKVERLRQNANVTYEEALAALNESNEDLLDAMVLLEKQGKVKKPSQSVYSTSYQEQMQYIDVPDKVAQQKKSAPNLGRSLAHLFRGIIGFVRSTSFRVTRGDTELFRLPSWLMVLIVLIFWKIALPAAIIALIFGFRYSFEGTENTDAANNVLTRAGEVAEDLKNGLRNQKTESAGRDSRPDSAKNTEM